MGIQTNTKTQNEQIKFWSADSIQLLLLFFFKWKMKKLQEWEKGRADILVCSSVNRAQERLTLTSITNIVLWVTNQIKMIQMPETGSREGGINSTIGMYLGLASCVRHAVCVPRALCCSFWTQSLFPMIVPPGRHRANYLALPLPLIRDLEGEKGPSFCWRQPLTFRLFIYSLVQLQTQMSHSSVIFTGGGKKTKTFWPNQQVSAVAVGSWSETQPPRRQSDMSPPPAVSKHRFVTCGATCCQRASINAPAVSSLHEKRPVGNKKQAFFFHPLLYDMISTAVPSGQVLLQVFESCCFASTMSNCEIHSHGSSPHTNL